MNANLLGFALVLATQILAGSLVVAAVGAPEAARGARFARALLLGPAAITLQMLAYGLLGIGFELVGILGPWWIAAPLLLGRRRRGELAPAEVGARPARVAAWCSLAVACAITAWVACSTPVHDSDALHNFALPAQVHASQRTFDPGALARLTDPGNVHYPPLLAFNECLYFLVDGVEGARALKIFSACGFLAWGLLLLEALWSAHRPRLSFAVFVLVLATREPMSNAILGLADLRLLATALLVLLEARRVRRGADGRLLAAAAIAAGLTKTEGYVVAALAALALACGARRLQLDGRRGLALAGIVVATVAPWPALVAVHRIPAEYELEVDTEVFRRAFDELPPAALGLSASCLSHDHTGASRWGVLFPAGLLCALARVLRRGERSSRYLLAAWVLHHLALSALLAGIAAATRTPPAWVLEATAERLAMLELAWLVCLLPTARDQAARAEVVR
jgi:hypothetical protein